MMKQKYFATNNWHTVGDPSDEFYPDESNPGQPWNHQKLKQSRSTARNSSERQRDRILPRASFLRRNENGAMSTRPGPTSSYQAEEMGKWEPKGTYWDWDRQDFLMTEKDHLHWKRNSPARRGFSSAQPGSVQPGDKKPETELPNTYKYRLPSLIWSPTRGRWVTGPTNSVPKVDAKMKGGRARKHKPSLYAAWEQDRFLQQDMEYLEELQAHNHAHRQTRVTRVPQYDSSTHQRRDSSKDKDYISHYHNYVQPQLMDREEDSRHQHSYQPESDEYTIYLDHPGFCRQRGNGPPSSHAHKPPDDDQDEHPHSEPQYETPHPGFQRGLRTGDGTGNPEGGEPHPWWAW